MSAVAKSFYGLYESKVIMVQAAQLLSNGKIGRYSGSWGSIIVLPQKPHREHITDIGAFIWHMCVSY